MKLRSLTIGVTLCAAATTLALSMLPAEHLHPSLQGRAVIHRHLIEMTAAHHPDLSLDHGDHHDVRVLQTVFEAGHRFALAPPFVGEDAVHISPDRILVGRIDTPGAQACHDPPQRLASLRAPPAQA